MKKIFKNNRRGVFSQIQLAILAIASILVFGLFLYKAYISLSENMSVQSCKDSIAAHSLIAQGSFSQMFTDVKCPTREITIRQLNKANEIIAEDMHRCWYIWGQGKGQYFKGDGNFCHVCAVYQFSDKGQKVNGLMEYLNTQEIQMQYPGDIQGLTYADYMMGYTTPKSAEIVKRNIEDLTSKDSLDTSQRYATIFVYASGKDAIDKILESGGRAVGLSAGSVALTLGTLASASHVGAATAAISSLIAGTATAGAVNVWNPVGWVLISAAAIAGGIIVIDAALSRPDIEQVSFIAFRPYNADELNALNCDQMIVNQMSNVGR